METRAQRDGPWAGAVIAALTHPFGVGGSRFRTHRPEPGEEPRWVDTVFCGCWRREVFERIGGFNERLERGQDMEFNQRLRRGRAAKSCWRRNWSSRITRARNWGPS